MFIVQTGLRVVDAGGDAGAVQMSRATDGVSRAKLLVRVPADRFRSFRESIRTLGHVSNDTVDHAKRGVGGPTPPFAGRKPWLRSRSPTRKSR